MKQGWILMNPGPVNVTAAVRKALLGPDLCHREPEFTKLLRNIRRKLVGIFGIEKTHEAAVLTGSGTLAVEAMLASYGGPRKKILVLSNGVYGERLAEILETHRIPHEVLAAPLGDFPSIRQIEARLLRDKKITAIAMIHHETSSGMLNPLGSVGRLAKRHRKTFLVDAVSSLGAEKIDFKNWGIGLLAASSGKCLHAFPGVSFVLVANKEIPALKSKRSGVTLDLARALGPDPAFTPAVQLYYALDAALDALKKEGLKNRLQSYSSKSRLLWEGLSRLGVRYLVTEDRRSHALLAAWLPPGVSYRVLHDRLKKNGFVIYAGQSRFKDKIFRISNLGDIKKSDLKRFLTSFEKIVGVDRARSPEAIVLAAGAGKRLGSLTRVTPKCLVPLSKDACLLKRYLETFRSLGLKEVTIVVGHQKEKILRAASKWGRGLKLRFVVNPDYCRGSILSLYRASHRLTRQVLIMDADVFFPAEALAQLIDSKESSAFLIDPRSKSSGEEMMLMAKKGSPWSISKKTDPSLDILGEATGIVRLDGPAARSLSKILDKFYRRDDLDREYEDAYCELLKQRKIGTVSMDGLFWSEIDFQEDLDAVSQALR